MKENNLLVTKNNKYKAKRRSSCPKPKVLYFNHIWGYRYNHFDFQRTLNKWADNYNHDFPNQALGYLTTVKYYQKYVKKNELVLT